MTWHRYFRFVSTDTRQLRALHKHIVATISHYCEKREKILNLLDISISYVTHIRSKRAEKKNMLGIFCCCSLDFRFNTAAALCTPEFS